MNSGTLHRAQVAPPGPCAASDFSGPASSVPPAPSNRAPRSVRLLRNAKVGRSTAGVAKEGARVGPRQRRWRWHSGAHAAWHSGAHAAQRCGRLWRARAASAKSRPVWAGPFRRARGRAPGPSLVPPRGYTTGVRIATFVLGYLDGFFCWKAASLITPRGEDPLWPEGLHRAREKLRGGYPSRP